MRGKSGAAGFLVLIVVVAVVLILSARAWRNAAPAALLLQEPGTAATPDDHGQPDAGTALRSGDLPNLHEMREQTGTHARQVQETLSQVE